MPPPLPPDRSPRRPHPRGWQQMSGGRSSPVVAVPRIHRSALFRRRVTADGHAPRWPVSASARRGGVAGSLPLAHHGGEPHRVVDVLLVRPLSVAGVLEEREVVLLVDAAVPRVPHPVPHLAHHPPAVLVDDVPLDRELGHLAAGIPGHARADPVVDGLPADEGPVVMLHVGGVLGELIGPRPPVAGASRVGRPALVGDERLFDLRPAPLCHVRGSLPAPPGLDQVWGTRSARSTPAPGSSPSCLLYTSDAADEEASV